MKSRRVVVISDLHCGHVVGLTHPDFNPKYQPGTLNYELSKVRAEYWKFFSESIAELRPIDILIVNGDCIEGKGPKSGGTELIESDRNAQVNMAVACIEECEANSVYMAYGTPYHVGESEDFEDTIAQTVKAVKIGDHDYLDVNGVVLDYRHHIGYSSSPQGRFTASARARIWNVLWSLHGQYPLADIIIRSHVHYFTHQGEDDWLAVTTPGLQGFGSKFGARRAEGLVHFGFLFFDITDKDNWTWGKYIYRRKSATALLKA